MATPSTARPRRGSSMPSSPAGRAGANAAAQRYRRAARQTRGSGCSRRCWRSAKPSEAAFANNLGKPAVESISPTAAGGRRPPPRAEAPRPAGRGRAAAPAHHALGAQGAHRLQPRGRLIIGPWNYPLSTLVGPLVSAVAAGNTVILKPSEFTPNVNAVIARIVAEVFEPAEVALVEGPVETSTPCSRCRSITCSSPARLRWAR